MKRKRGKQLTIYDAIMEIEKLERCGYCGRYFKGKDYITLEEIKDISPIALDTAPAGYCPEAQGETGEAEERRYITRDMAIDAGDPSLEGQPYN